MQPAFKITVSGLPAPCSCKALTSCQAWSGPNMQELWVGIAGEGTADEMLTAGMERWRRGVSAGHPDQPQKS